MPSNYNGVAGSATGSTVTVSIPSDGDTDNAADLNAGTKRAADWLQRIWNLVGALFTTANSWTASQTFSAGIDMANTFIHNVWPPSAGTDAANKNYVDGAVGPVAVTYPAMHVGSWVTGQPKPCWWQDTDGTLHIQGYASFSGSGSTYKMWDNGTIPVGAAPTGSAIFQATCAVISNTSPFNTTGNLFVQADGSVWVEANTSTNFNAAYFSFVWRPGTALAP